MVKLTLRKAMTLRGGGGDVKLDDGQSVDEWLKGGGRVFKPNSRRLPLPPPSRGLLVLLKVILSSSVVCDSGYPPVPPPSNSWLSGRLLLLQI